MQNFAIKWNPLLTGSGLITSLSVGSLLDDNIWHDVVISRNFKEIIFSVDRVSITGTVNGDYAVLNLNNIVSPFFYSREFLAKKDLSFSEVWKSQVILHYFEQIEKCNCPSATLDKSRWVKIFRITRKASRKFTLEKVHQNRRIDLYINWNLNAIKRGKIQKFSFFIFSSYSSLKSMSEH